jgi:hypothetical protein
MDEMYSVLLMARDKPSVLDDEIIQRTIRLCHNQRALIPAHREQLKRWLTASPTSFQRDEILRLSVIVNDSLKCPVFDRINGHFLT